MSEVDMRANQESMLAFLLVVIESNSDEVLCQRYTKTRALAASVSYPALTALEKGRRGY
jgi:hypothetical protein